MAHVSGDEDFHGLLGKIFNALSEGKIEKAGKKLAKLVRRYSEDPRAVKPVLFVLEQMAAKGDKSDVAAMARNVAFQLPFISGFGLLLLGKAKEIEGKPSSRSPRPAAF